MAWVYVVVWMVAIFGMSSLPGGTVPGGFSVQGHLVEYGVLGLLAFRAFSSRLSPAMSAVAAVALASGYGVTDELHQLFVPGRMSDVRDWATDTVGAAAVVALAWAWTARSERGSVEEARQ